MKDILTQSLSNIPTPMSGLALGIASLGVCLEYLYTFHGLAQNISMILASILLLFILIKFMVHPHLIKQDLSHAVVGSVIPTFAMATMVISTTVAKLSLSLAVFLWLVAIAFHLVFLVKFTIHRMRDFELHHMVPSWFVPPVGIIVAAVTFPNVAVLLPLAEGLLIFGIATYAILLPIILYRLIFSATVPDAAKPTLAVLAAPASLSLAGYLTIVANPNPLMIALLGGIAVLMTALVYLSLINLLRLPFSPGYAAFTFPLVISSIAMYKTSEWMLGNSLLSEYSSNIHAIASFEAVIAALVVVYVFGHFLNVFYHFILNFANLGVRNELSSNI
ncbi:MAG: exfoliative toxin A/B [Francisellaceae bacterium]|jgi:exfoliative toxin A/B